MKPSTYERFSPSRVTVEVTPRWTQSGETDVILGTGWEWAKTAWKNASRKAHRRREASHEPTHAPHERSSRGCEAAAEVDVKSAARSPRRLPLIAGRFLGERKRNTLSPSKRRSNQTTPA